MSFSIRDDNSSSHLTISLLRPYTSTSSYDDWLDVEVQIKAGEFSGKYRASFLSNEMAWLQPELREIYKNLLGSFTFRTTECQLEFTVKGDGRGHFEAECDAQESFMGSRLIFTLKFDQTHIPRMIRELEEMLS